MAWSAWCWLGVTGAGLCLLASTRFLRRTLLYNPRQFAFDIACLQRIWHMPWAVCVTASEGPQWLFRDELPAGAWAELLRTLLREVPAQAEGLSISN